VSRWDGYRLNDTPYGREAPSCGLLGSVTEDKRSTPIGRHFKPSRLYFWTWTSFFTLSHGGMGANSKLERGLHQFSILDANGDWCGTVVLPEWTVSGGIFEFAAVSEARDFSVEELKTWTYYIPEDRDGAEWYAFNAIMLKWHGDDEDGRFAERIGLAKIYQRAFLSASCDPGTFWKEITLA
jgi:hypothetical protein